jgi:hypothetical protein
MRSHHSFHDKAELPLDFIMNLSRFIRITYPLVYIKRFKE